MKHIFLTGLLALSLNGMNREAADDPEPFPTEQEWDPGELREEFKLDVRKCRLDDETLKLIASATVRVDPNNVPLAHTVILVRPKVAAAASVEKTVEKEEK